MKIHLVEAELFHADRQTDRQPDRQGDKTQLTGTFRNFSKASKMVMDKYLTHSIFCLRIHVMWKKI